MQLTGRPKWVIFHESYTYSQVPASAHVPMETIASAQGLGTRKGLLHTNLFFVIPSKRSRVALIWLDPEADVRFSASPPA